MPDIIQQFTAELL